MSTSVCVSVGLSVLEPHMQSLPIFLCMLTMAVAQSSSSGVTKSQGEGAIFGFSSPLTMHCNAFAAKGIGRERGDGCAQHGRRVTYDCLV